jgi:ABC-type protease/lipase transport system fused ATPase/permease subunit
MNTVQIVLFLTSFGLGLVEVICLTIAVCLTVLNRSFGVALGETHRRAVAYERAVRWWFVGTTTLMLLASWLNRKA